MRHAYLIMAHDRPEELKKLVVALDHPDNDIFVHVDASSSMDLSFLASCAQNSTVTCIKRQKVVWGGSSQIQVELALFSEAYHAGEYGYYHLLSGVDYPVKDNTYIHSYFEKYNGLNFVSIEHELPRQDMRYQQYHLFHERFVGKKRNIWKYIDFGCCSIQRIVGIKRFRGKKLDRHINWVSLTGDMVKYLVDNRDNINKKYRWTYCCDEIFILEQLRESPYYNTLAPQGNVRYIEWQWFSSRDCSPRVLTDNDLNALADPDILFARKFNLPASAELYKLLKGKNENHNTSSLYTTH